MSISNEKIKELYKLINISEVKTKYDSYCTEGEEVKYKIGLDVKFDLYVFKNLNIYISGMILIDEYLIKDYIIKNLEDIWEGTINENFLYRV